MKTCNIHVYTNTMVTVCLFCTEKYKPNVNNPAIAFKGCY